MFAQTLETEKEHTTVERDVLHREVACLRGFTSKVVLLIFQQFKKNPTQRIPHPPAEGESVRTKMAFASIAHS